MPYSITTKDGITIQNIPDDIKPDADVLKQRVSKERATRDGTTQPEIQAQTPDEQPQEQGFFDRAISGVARVASGLIDTRKKVIGGVEGALALGSGLIAEPIAGIAGIAAGLDPFRDEGAAAQTVADVKKALTFDPSTDEGKAAIGGLGEALKPAVDKLQQFKQFIGDDAFAATDNAALAAIATALPEALIEVVGGGVGRRAALRGAQATPVAQAKEGAIRAIEESEQATGIKPITSDVLPPESRTGKFFQARGEEVAPSVRVEQQSQRTRAAETLLNKFDVDEAARFESSIVESVKASIKGRKAAAKEAFESSSGELSKLGDVAINRTTRFAEKIAEGQGKLGSLQQVDTGILKEVQPFLDAPTGLNFNDIKTVRSAIGAKLSKAKQGAPVTGSGDVGLLSQLYSNLTRDMQTFAKRASPELRAKWMKANDDFSKFAIGGDKTGFKNIIRKGDATPEVVDNLLFSKKGSDLDFLVKNLDDAGKKAAGQRILQRVLEKSTKGGQSLNPNFFQKELANHKGQINKFFTAAEKQGIDALHDALRQTRRAQDAGALPPTGINLVGMLNIANPKTLVPGLIQALIERPSLRNILVKRKAAKTVKEKFTIDEQLKAEIDRLGLAAAVTTGAIIDEQEPKLDFTISGGVKP